MCPWLLGGLISPCNFILLFFCPFFPIDLMTNIFRIHVLVENKKITNSIMIRIWQRLTRSLFKYPFQWDENSSEGVLHGQEKFLFRLQYKVWTWSNVNNTVSLSPHPQTNSALHIEQIFVPNHSIKQTYDVKKCYHLGRYIWPPITILSTTTTTINHYFDHRWSLFST